MSGQSREPPIGGHFEVEVDRLLPEAGGGLDAFVAFDRRGGGDRIMAVRVPDRAAPRAQPLAALAKVAIPFCLVPIAHGVARDAGGWAAQFVVCPAPPGASLAALAEQPPWSEAELLETLLRPAAAALAALQARHVTHRAIRPDNVFQPARGQPVTLGCAWAAPPACLQPAAYEPAYSGACPPDVRHDGLIADDVYALGVLMVALASAAHPLSGLDASSVVATKLAMGGAAAVIGAARLPPMIADLARGMLAEDPEHRPSPAMLADPETARARRVAARPRRRAQRSIEIGALTAWDARGLAQALASEPERAIQILRGGVADQWLRRRLGDASLALVVEEAVRQRASEVILDDADADAVLLLRAVATLDPLAPLCWRGLRLWPEALGSALAAASPEQEAEYVRMLNAEAFALWALARAQRADPVRAQLDARQLRALLRQRGGGGGIARLRYAGAALLPCRSRLVGAMIVVTAIDVLSALEAASARPDRPELPIDAELASFLAARLDFRMDAEFATMGHAKAQAQEVALALMRVLARLQSRHATLVVPGLAGWLANTCGPMVARVRGRDRRAHVRLALDQHVAAGRLGALLALLESPALRDVEDGETAEARMAMARLDNDILVASERLRGGWTEARRLGREIAVSIGLILLAGSIVWTAL